MVVMVLVNGQLEILLAKLIKVVEVVVNRQAKQQEMVVDQESLLYDTKKILDMLLIKGK
jgi:hypothetical protein